VTFIIAAIVVPEEDCSIAMTRDCFELGSAFLVLRLSAAGAGFEDGTEAADDAVVRCFADFDIEILRSVDGGVAPHHRSPIAAMKPAGQDLWAPLAPGTGDSTALLAIECQSILDNIIAHSGPVEPECSRRGITINGLTILSDPQVPFIAHGSQ